jgi:drug/metabolite transporter (DMT)-like permease
MSLGRFDGRSLLAVALLFVCGLLWGAMPMLSKIAVQTHAHPVGLSLLVNSIGAVVCLGLCWMRGVFYWPRWRDLQFFMTWAIFYSVLNQVMIYWLAIHMDAAIVSVFTVLEGLFIFAAAAALGLERPSLRRCCGLLIGLAGMACLFAVGQFGQAKLTPLFLLVGFLIPLSYAAESIYIATRRPAAIDPLMAVAMVMLCSVPLLFAVAWVTDDFMPVQFPPGKTEVMAGLIMAATLLANLAYFVLIRLAGAVFAGQVAYFNALCGVGWGVMLLGESISTGIVLALALILCGLMLVRPAPPPVVEGPTNVPQPWPAQ